MIPVLPMSELEAVGEACVEATGQYACGICAEKPDQCVAGCRGRYGD